MAFEYAAKVVCGRSTGQGFAKGYYRTAINIHNPAPSSVDFRAKAAVARPVGRTGTVSPFWNLHLEPDYATEIECDEVLERAGAGSFMTGFVIVQSPTELDVVAVYTASPGSFFSLVTSMDVERVPARVIGTIV